MANWGFEYKDENYSFVNLVSVTDDILPHGQELQSGGCGFGSPKEWEETQRGNFDVQLRGVKSDFDNWKDNIAKFNLASLQSMTTANYNDIEGNWSLIIDHLLALRDSLNNARTHIMEYKGEWRERDRICNSAGWWRDIRDSNRELRNDVNTQMILATQLRQNAVDLETGVPPTFPTAGSGGGGSGGSVTGCTDVNATNYNPSATSDDGTCGQKSQAELNVILAGKVLLGIVGVFIGYKLIKKFKK